MLPYKESSAEPLLKSLGLLLRLDPAVAWELAAPLSTELLKMVKASAAHIKSARGWKTVCALINMTALHPEASQASFEAFSLVCKDDKLLSDSNFAPCLETALVFLDRHAKVCHCLLYFASVQKVIEFTTVSWSLFVPTFCIYPLH